MVTVERSTYKGKPILALKDGGIVLMFGRVKAKLILDAVGEIEKFVKETEESKAD